MSRRQAKRAAFAHRRRTARYAVRLFNATVRAFELRTGACFRGLQRQLVVDSVVYGMAVVETRADGTVRRIDPRDVRLYR